MTLDDAVVGKRRAVTAATAARQVQYHTTPSPSGTRKAPVVARDNAVVVGTGHVQAMGTDESQRYYLQFSADVLKANAAKEPPTETIVRIAHQLKRVPAQVQNLAGVPMSRAGNWTASEVYLKVNSDGTGNLITEFVLS